MVRLAPAIVPSEYGKTHMAHEIDFSTGRAAMAYIGQTPWHGLGRRLEEGATIETWQQAAGMEWEVLRSKVRFAIEQDGTGERVWNDKHVLFRSDTKMPLGVVSSSYCTVQPKEVLEFFRDLTSGMGFTLETAGCLFQGRRFWALARVTGDVAMIDPEDKVGGYLLLSTSADGTLATTARFTTIRVVCNNTLSVAINGKPGYSLPHSTTFNPETAKAELGLKRETLVGGFASAMDMLRRLAAKPITTLDAADATLRLFNPDLDTMTTAEREKAAKARNVQTVRDLAAGIRLIGADMRGASGTAWGWLTAVTQHVDHEKKTKTQDRRLDSAWFGPGDILKRRALGIATEMATGTAAAEIEAVDDREMVEV